MALSTGVENVCPHTDLHKDLEDEPVWCLIKGNVWQARRAMGRGGEAGAGPIGPLMLVCVLECDVVMGSHWEISSKAGAEAGLSKAPWWPCENILIY